MNWSHHPEISTLKDEILKEAAGEIVSFTFTCDVEGKEIESATDDKENRRKKETKKGSIKLGWQAKSNGVTMLGKRRGEGVRDSIRLR